MNEVPIKEMPGNSRRIPESGLPFEIERIAHAGIKAVMLFGVSHHKDEQDRQRYVEIPWTARKDAPLGQDYSSGTLRPL